MKKINKKVIFDVTWNENYMVKLSFESFEILEMFFIPIKRFNLGVKRHWTVH